MADMRAALAFHRFGLGARPGDLDRLKGAARDALLGELRQPPSAFFETLKPSHLALQDLMEFQGEKRAARQVAKQQQQQTPPQQTQAPVAPDTKAPEKKATTAPPAPAKPPEAMQPAPVNPVPAIFQGEMQARFRTGLRSDIGFRDRLVLFWSNHFSISAINPRVRVLAGAYEREAIRPHLTGRFSDMLLAVTRHPAMLIYLDNAQSIGPNSIAGLRMKRGLNENLAREILELHTLGVDGGYTQDDVTRFAEVLTGWSIVAANGQGGVPGTFLFRPAAHEPGPRKVLGENYPQLDQSQARAVLEDLARHPSTARHIARKLCRHFIADDPPPSAVERVAAAFKASDGNLTAVYEALLSAPEAWEPRLMKLRPPYEFVLATLRALDVVPEPGQVARALQLLGHIPFQAASPKGWPEEAGAWAAPDAFKTRLDFAEQAAKRALRSRPLELAQGVLGPLLSDETTTAIKRAESESQATTLLLMAPEFQRR
ncbi:MAG: DUF1800 family protein [Hyphomicrobiaceae bacterium]|nr:MAG: DUF1800 family protein [Hyphomicrobiaceae bacterium]